MTRFYNPIFIVSVLALSLFFPFQALSSTLPLPIWHFQGPFSDSSTMFSSHLDSGNAQVRVAIPHTFNESKGLEQNTIGFAWYITDVRCPDTNTGSDYFLDFEGVCLRAKVLVNGVFAGECRKAYMPFRVDITKFFGKNKSVQVAVQVDNRLLKNDFPDVNCNGWWMYGGLIREVTLKAVPRQRIENVQIRTFYKGNGTFSYTLAYDTVGAGPDKVVVKIISPSGKMVKLSLKGKPHHLSGVMNKVEAWSPDAPNLYRFELTPVWDGKRGEAVTINRGFCQLSVKEGDLLLNGSRIFLRGIGRHDVIGDRGAVVTRAERLRDLVAIKACGANMLRIAHFPQHRDMYELCDSLGLIVMDEMPAWKSSPLFLESDAGKRAGTEYMTALIRAHGNYACIGLWCLGNELHSVKDRVANYIRYIADTTRKLDPSRLVTYTTYFYQFDKAYAYCDVISINEYFGWYLGSVDMLPGLFESIAKDNPGKPILVSEFGASSALGNRNPSATLAGPIRSMVTKDFSEDYQALLYEKQIQTIWDNRKVCKGAVVWSYCDFRECRKSPNDKTLGSGINGMGLVTEDRKPKLSFGVVEREFRKIAQEIKRRNPDKKP